MTKALTVLIGMIHGVFLLGVLLRSSSGWETAFWGLASRVHVVVVSAALAIQAEEARKG